MLGLRMDGQHHLQLDMVSRATELRYSWAATNHTGDISIKVDMVFNLYNRYFVIFPLRTCKTFV